MKILLVDDNQTRISRFLEYFVNGAIVARADVVICTTGVDAREKLVDHHFDLLIIDIIIPYYVEDEPSPDTSLAILAELVETDRLIKPRHIVGITAYPAETGEVSRTFRDYTWAVVSAGEASNYWLEQIQRCIIYIGHELGHVSEPDYKEDVLIVSALRSPEMTAIHQLPWNWEPESPLDENTFYRRGKGQWSDGEFTVVSSVAPRMGMLSSALLVDKLIKAFRPRYCVMAGICAGVAGQTQIGDVIFAQMSWDYQSGKYYSDSDRVSAFSVDPYVINSSPSLVASIEQLGLEQSVWVDIWQGADDRPINPPRLLVGAMASGSAVLADPNVTRKIVEQQRKVKAIDMEVFGVYSAAELSMSPKPKFFALKSVCDFADAAKGDDWQRYCSYVSAHAVKNYVERFLKRFN